MGDGRRLDGIGLVGRAMGNMQGIGATAIGLEKPREATGLVKCRAGGVTKRLCLSLLAKPSSGHIH